MCPDWSVAVWYVYQSPAGTRVMAKELLGDGWAKAGTPERGQMMFHEVKVAQVGGVSRRTVLNLLKQGVRPERLAGRIAEMEQDRYVRRTTSVLAAA